MSWLQKCVDSQDGSFGDIKAVMLYDFPFCSFIGSVSVFHIRVICMIYRRYIRIDGSGMEFLKDCLVFAVVCRARCFFSSDFQSFFQDSSSSQNSANADVLLSGLTLNLGEKWIKS